MFPHLTDADIRCVADAIFRALSKVARQATPQALREQNATLPMSS
jgi:hypothetical protein